MQIQELDLQRQERAKEYSRISRRMMLVSWVWSAFYALLWLIVGWGVVLKAHISTFTGNEWLVLAAFAAVFAGVSSIIEIPLSYFTGFVLPHRYEMSNQTLKDWVIDQLKGFLVGAPIGLLVLELIYLFLRIFPESWWLWAAGFMLVFSVVLGRLAPVLIMPIFNKFVPLESEYAELAERLVRLAERANTNVKGVYKFDMSRRTNAANAALTGIGSSRRIILGDTLLEEFEMGEIEAVLAHELGHHVNKDIPIGILINGVTMLAGLYLTSLGLQTGIALFGFESAADVAALPLLILILGAYGLVTMPLGNTYSRWRERKADRYALEATGSGDAYAEAMTRLANQNLADVDPEPWVEFMLHSHPALGKRIKMAREFGRADLG
jgi:STE24 endopeptidase